MNASDKIRYKSYNVLMANIAIFNKKVEEFFADLVYVFPENKDLTEVRNKYRLLKTFGEKLPLALFKEKLPLYKDKLIEKNDQFFIEFPFATLDKNQVQRIKNCWQELDDINKEVIWDHIFGLIKIGG
jgi:hypothetical protein